MRAILCTAFSVALLLASATQAAIVQFDAESGTLGADFSTSAVAGALGGVVIADNGGGSSGNDNEAVYDVIFAEAGTYDLYARWVVPGSGGQDSFFVGATFGDMDSSDFGSADWQQLNGLNAGPFEISAVATVDGPIYGTLPAGSIVWINLSSNWIENVTGSINEEISTYVVAAPGSQRFEVGGRETGMQLDAFAFATSGSEVFVNNDGNLTHVPEPTGLAILGLIGITLCHRRV